MATAKENAVFENKHEKATPVQKKDSAPEKEYEFKDDATVTPVSGDVEVQDRNDREPSEEELERAKTTGIALELPPGAFRVSGKK